MVRQLIVGSPLIALGREGVIEDGALVVEDGRITAVGPRMRLEQEGPFDSTLGSSAHIVMPGFVNGHYHSEGTLGLIFWEAGIERYSTSWHPQFAVPISEEALHNAILIGLLDCVKGGQTGIVDMYYGSPGLPNFGADAALQAYRDAGVRVAFGLCLRDQNIYVHGSNEHFLAQLPSRLSAAITGTSMGYAWPIPDLMATYRNLVERWDDPTGRIRVILAPDWTPACSDHLYRSCAETADEFGTGMTSHVLESRWEMQYNLKEYGRTAVRRLADLGVLGPNLTCAHLVWTTDEDLAIFADSGAVASNDPASNLRLSTGIARMRDLFDLRGRLIVGTDGISFSEREDFFQELRLAAYLQRRPVDLTYGRIDSEAFLRTITESGAQALCQQHRLGSLEVGKQADLLIVRRERVFWPEARYRNVPTLDVLLDRAEASDIEAVVVAGEVLVRNGRVVTVNEEKVRDAYADEIERRVGLLTSDASIRREFVELPAEVEPYVIDFYHNELRQPLDPGFIYNTRNGPLGEGCIGESVMGLQDPLAKRRRRVTETS
jgi:5-methylthioadenosine/S-adenosylhomocysteine deaminase